MDKYCKAQIWDGQIQFQRCDSLLVDIQIGDLIH